MKFGAIAVADATGALLAHNLKIAGRRLRKGQALQPEDIEFLQAAGLETLVVVQLQTGDVGENEAAGVLADALCGEGVAASDAATGRSNLFAVRDGLLMIDKARLDQVNSVDESLTVATLEPFSVVAPRQMLATVKVIPLAVGGDTLESCVAAARAGSPLLRVLPFQRRRVGLIQTRLPGIKESVLDKTVQVLGARVQALGGNIVRELRCEHDEAATAGALGQLLSVSELILLVGASAIIDRRDVIPAAMERIGGRIEHYGMPVDPGNLMLLGYRDDLPILALPGSARSPKYSGFDIVLPRLAAGLRVGRRDIMALGAGGLLKEIASRPTPRAEASKPPVACPAPRKACAALLLAAGQSRRMGKANKLLLEVDGTPMLVKAAQALRDSQVERVVVVTGYERERVERMLADFPGFLFVHNPNYADGLSTSLRHGLSALAEDSEGVLVCLGDMPRVSSVHIDRLIAAFDPLDNRAICVPTFDGKRGNPILWAKRFFAEMREVGGDVGARHLLGEYPDQVCEVAMADRGVLIDVDSPDAMRRIQGDAP